MFCLLPDATTQMFPTESAITATYMAAVTEAEDVQNYV